MKGGSIKTSFLFIPINNLTMIEEEQIILPSGFKRVEYLQNSGTQWIQTDYCPSNETKIESDF